MTQTKRLVAGLATAALLFGAPIAFAQTTTDTTGGTSVTSSTTGTGTTATTPGAPNTGAGGDATENLLLLGVSGLIAVAGGLYLTTRKTALR